MRCAPHAHDKRQVLQILMDVLQDTTNISSSNGSGSSSSTTSSSNGIGSSSGKRGAAAATAPSAASVLRSYGASLPLLGALVTASKVVAAEEKWPVGDLGVTLRQLLMLARLTFELLGQLLRTSGGDAGGGAAGSGEDRKQQEQQGGEVQWLDVRPPVAVGPPGWPSSSRYVKISMQVDCAVTGAVHAAVKAVYRAFMAAHGSAVAAVANWRTCGQAAAEAAALKAAEGAAAAVVYDDLAFASASEGAKAATVAALTEQSRAGVSAVMGAAAEGGSEQQQLARGNAAVEEWAETCMTGDVLAVVYAVAAAEAEAAGGAAGDASLERPCEGDMQQNEEGLGHFRVQQDGKRVSEALLEGAVQGDLVGGRGRDGCAQSQQREQQDHCVYDLRVKGGRGDQRGQQQQGDATTQSVCRAEQAEGLLRAGLLCLRAAIDTMQQLTHAAAGGAEQKVGVVPSRGHGERGAVLLAAIKAIRAAAADSSKDDGSRVCQRSNTTTAESQEGSSAPAAAAVALHAASVRGNGTRQGGQQARFIESRTMGSVDGTPANVAATAAQEAGASGSAVAAAAGEPGTGFSSSSCGCTQSGLSALKEAPLAVKELLELLYTCPLPSALGCCGDTRVYDSWLEQHGDLFLLETSCSSLIDQTLAWEGRWWQCPAEHSAGDEFMPLFIEAWLKLQGVSETAPWGEFLGSRALAEVQQCELQSSKEWVVAQVRRWRLEGHVGSMQMHKVFCRLSVLVESILCRLPVAFCCNNARCRRVGGTSELAGVVGRNRGVCQQCRAACYCSRQCQEEAWPLHQQVCKALSSRGRGCRPADQA